MGRKNVQSDTGSTGLGDVTPTHKESGNPEAKSELEKGSEQIEVDETPNSKSAPADGDVFEGLSSADAEEIDFEDETEDSAFAELGLDWDNEEIPEAGESKKPKRWFIVSAVLFLTVAAVLFSLWWLFFLKKPPYPLPAFLKAFTTQQQESKSLQETLLPSIKQEIKEAPFEKIPQQRETSPQNRHVEALEAKATPESILKRKLAEMSGFRSQLLQKQEQIRNLQQSYHEQINIVEKEILREKEREEVNSFSEAIKNKAIEYGLRTIQRRKIYMDNLNIPFNQLHLASEELLYFERLSDILLKLQPVVQGISLEQLTGKIDGTLQKHRDRLERLTVDIENLPSLDLNTTWKEVLNKTKKKVDLPKRDSKDDNPQNQVKINSQILDELSRGEFSRKRYLTWLSPEGAKAISKWSGKVLYLNGLSNLHPSTAEKLANWRGDWLCLNGIKKISPGTARGLARWSGKRLSLNGLEAISEESAAELLKWRGVELEMVGLTQASSQTIGHLRNWRNSGKKVYLSKRFANLQLME